MLPTMERKSNYDPHRHRRQVRRAGDGFRVKSMTRNDGTAYTLSVDAAGSISCDCWQGQNVHRHMTVWSPETELCKHARQLMRRMEREHSLPQQQGQHGPACHKCGAMDADSYYPLCDERGEPMPGHVCCDCAHDGGDDLRDAEPVSDQVRAEIVELLEEF